MYIEISSLPGEMPVLRTTPGELASSRCGKRVVLYLVQLGLDVALLLGSFLASGWLYFGGAIAGGTFLAGELMALLYLAIAFHNSTYSLDSLRHWRAGTGKMVSAMLIAAGLLNLLAFLVKSNASFSRVMFVGGWVLAVTLMIAARWLMGRAVKRQWGANPLNILQIDAGGPPMRIPCAHYVDAEQHGLRPELDDPHMLDRLASYLRNMDQVIVNCPQDTRRNWAMVLKGSGIHGEITFGMEHTLGALGLSQRGGTTTLVVAAGPLGLRAGASKRLFDIGASLAALIVLSPLLLTCAMLIKLEDGGPVMFRQRRLGRCNRFFRIYKLRTMQVQGGDDDGQCSAGRADRRVTRIGSFLRRTSLDELPQLLNVLAGDMSLVGPRPHALGSQAGDKLFWQVDQRYWQRHSLRPGITGLAQVRGLRGATDKEDDLSARLQADLEYLASWSIWRDVQIIAATFRVLRHERAF